MIKINKKFIYIAATIVVVIGVATGTVLILKSANTSTTQTQTQTQAQKDAAIKATAEDLMTQSAKATDAASAKALLLQAREKYVQIDDKDRIGAVDAMVIMIDNTPAPKSATK